MAHAILVLQVEIEAGGVTQLQYRWRNHRIYQGVAVLQELLLGTLGNFEHSIVTVSFIPWLQVDERNP